jgi:hypothetical protein
MKYVKNVSTDRGLETGLLDVKIWTVIVVEGSTLMKDVVV